MEVEIGHHTESNIFISYISALLAGVLTVLGIFFKSKSLSYGSMEVAQLFINMRVLVQMLEEFLIFQIIPSIISSIGVVLALIGSSIMIFFDYKHKEEIELMSHTNSVNFDKLSDKIENED